MGEFIFNYKDSFFLGFIPNAVKYFLSCFGDTTLIPTLLMLEINLVFLIPTLFKMYSE